MALECEDVEEILVGITNIDSVSRRFTCGDPEQSEQAHDVVDAKAAPVAHRRTEHCNERLVPCCTQLPGIEWRKSPALALSIEQVGWRTNREVRRQDVLIEPR